MRIRTEHAANYRAVFHNGKTLRFPLDPAKPITELQWPEFYDVSLNTKCFANCPFCYTDAKTNGINYANVVEKIQWYFGEMTLNRRPVQVALGGGGEPTLHPEFIEVLKAFHSLQIVPNYTTNGMHLTPELLVATKQYCGGVAVSCHPHLEKHWRQALRDLYRHNIKVNLHIVISDAASVQLLDRVYTEYKDMADYFVLLPYMATGRAIAKSIDLPAVEAWVDKHKDYGKIAFGSHFYEFLKDKDKWGISLYPPEIMSKYLLLDDAMSVFNNSFERRPATVGKASPKNQS